MIALVLNLEQIRNPPATASSIEELREQLETNVRLQSAFLDANADVKFLSDTNDEMGRLLEVVSAELATVTNQLVHAERTGTIGRLLLQFGLAMNEWDAFLGSFSRLVSTYEEAQFHGMTAEASIKMYMASRDYFEEKIRLHNDWPDLAATYPFLDPPPDLRQVAISNQWRSDALLSGERYDELWEDFLAERKLALDRLDAIEELVEEFIVEVRELARIDAASAEAAAFVVTAESARSSLHVATSDIRARLLDLRRYDELLGLMTEVEAIGDLTLPSSPD